MPTSWIEVANSALIKLGTGVISAFNDSNKAERLTNLRYEAARDTVLRFHNWNCAMTRVNTAPLVTPTPAFGYTYYHAQPTDCLRIVAIGPEGADYKVEGRYIATDDTVLELKYIKRVTDPTELDYMCAEAIACYLAWDLAPSFLNDDDKRNRLKSDFMELLRQAKSVDGKEDPTQILEAEEWLNSRHTQVGTDRSHNWEFN